MQNKENPDKKMVEKLWHEELQKKHEWHKLVRVNQQQWEGKNQN